MRVRMLHYPIVVLGPGKRLGIWVQGCQTNCYRCMARELQPYDDKCLVTIDQLMGDILPTIIRCKIHQVTISGGEPFDNDDLDQLLLALREVGIDDILCYTGYTLQNLQSRSEIYVAKSLALISVLVDGPYIDELNDDLAIRGSSNQRIHFFDSTLKDTYVLYQNEPRQFQVVSHDNLILYYGMLPKGFDLK